MSALLLQPDPFSEEIDRRLGAAGALAAFEESWHDPIQFEWQRQSWPTFKDMARDLYLMGYTRAIIEQMLHEPEWKHDG